MKKKTFDFYRYQLVPKDYIELSLFDKTYDVEEIKARKNIFFAEMLKQVHFENRRGKLPFKINMAQDNIYWVQLANLKEAKYVSNFEEYSITSEPYVNILFDNDSTRQIIAISRNPNAYDNTGQVVDILLLSLNPMLEKYNLKMYISPINENDTFWNIIKRVGGNITRIEIEIIKPNMSNISSCLKEEVKTLIEKTNSHTTTLKLESTENGILENINQNNEGLTGMIEYSAAGGGNIKVKAKGRKEIIQTKNSIKKTRVSFDFDVKTDKPEVISEIVNNILNNIK